MRLLKHGGDTWTYPNRKYSIVHKKGRRSLYNKKHTMWYIRFRTCWLSQQFPLTPYWQRSRRAIKSFQWNAPETSHWKQDVIAATKFHEPLSISGLLQETRHSLADVPDSKPSSTTPQWASDLLPSNARTLPENIDRSDSTSDWIRFFGYLRLELGRFTAHRTSLWRIIQSEV